MKLNSIFTLACAVALVASLCVFAGGCAHWPATPRLEQAGAPGYRFAEVTRPGQSDDLLVILAISGGGTRAAALGYGVLEELRRTEVTVNGVKRRLLDEVDVISAVSGGTFPATYYALRGEKTFEEFETKVLSRKFESELAKRIILNPVNWFRLPSGTFGKSDLFAELYDETVFDHATFADLKRANGPLVIINGTDITIGARFSFTQDQFDAICGDLSKVTLGRAVATSTALPPLLTPISFENRGGTCGRKAPAWQAAAEAAAAGSETPGRALLPRPGAPVLRGPGPPVRPRLRRRSLGESRPGRSGEGHGDPEGLSGRNRTCGVPPGAKDGGDRRERPALPRGGLGQPRRAAGHGYRDRPDVVDPGGPDHAGRRGAGA